MAAKEANGIKFNKPAINMALNNKKNPCIIVDNFDLPPKLILSDLLTITCVTGNPPIKPDTILPKPCAFNSLLVGVTLLSGSNLSVASTLNKVSKLATMASTIAIFQTSKLLMAEKSGKVNWPKKSPIELGTGTYTICCAFKLNGKIPLV